jgi:hypothetical protein
MSTRRNNRRPHLQLDFLEALRTVPAADGVWRPRLPRRLPSPPFPDLPLQAQRL